MNDSILGHGHIETFLGKSRWTEGKDISEYISSMRSEIGGNTKDGNLKTLSLGQVHEWPLRNVVKTLRSCYVQVCVLSLVRGLQELSRQRCSNYRQGKWLKCCGFISLLLIVPVYD